MNLEINKTYRLYGKMKSMKNFKPVSKSQFVTNLIHADLFKPKNEDDLDKLLKELNFLSRQGNFEFREVIL